jgi:hypothetical protein
VDDAELSDVERLYLARNRAWSMKNGLLVPAVLAGEVRRTETFQAKKLENASSAIVSPAQKHW